MQNDTSPVIAAQRASDRALVQTILTTVIVGLIAYLAFVFFRCRVKYLYQAWLVKYYSADSSIIKIPPGFRNAFVAWILAVIRLDITSIVKTHGLDAVIYLLLLKSILKLMLGFMAYGVIVLIPVDATGGRQYLNDTDVNKTTGTAIISMGNIDLYDPGDQYRFIAHGIGVIYNSALCYYVFYRLYHQVTALKIRYRNDVNRPDNYVVRVSGLRRYSKKEIFKYFNTLFPGQVLDVIQVAKVNKLRDKIKNLRMFEEKFEEAEEANKKKAKKHNDVGPAPRQQMRKFPIDMLSCCAPLCCCYQKVDEEDHWKRKIERAREKINRMRQTVVENEDRFPHTSTAYVVFKSIMAARICSQLVYSPAIKDFVISKVDDESLPQNLDFLSHFKARPAPEPRDIVWKNHSIPAHSKLLRNVIISAIQIFMILFYTIPVTFASSLANITSLAQIPFLSWLKELENSPIIKSAVEGILPALVIMVFFEVLYLGLSILARLKGHKTRSKRDRGIFTIFFWFQIINIFLASLLAGTFFGIIDDIYRLALSPSEVLALLGHKLPSQVNFFINYIAVNSIMRHFLFLLRPAHLLVYTIKRCFAKTQRQKKNLQEPWAYDYPYFMAIDLLVFTIILTYSSIATLILIFGVIYFVLANLSARYNLVYAYKQKYEGWGRMWTTIFSLLMSSMLLYQLTLGGVFVINAAATKSSVLVAMAAIAITMAVATIIFWWYTVKRLNSIGYYGALGASVLENSSSTTSYLIEELSNKEKLQKKKRKSSNVEAIANNSSESKGSDASHANTLIQLYTDPALCESLQKEDKFVQLFTTV